MNLMLPTEDFWARKVNAQTHAHSFHALGAQVQVSSNGARVVEAAKLSAQRFSHAATGAKTMRLEFVVRPTPAETPPANWPEQLSYSGVGEWISLSAGAWGYGVGNRQTRTAFVVLAQSLAEQTQLISRYFVDHYILNFLFQEWAMLHASCAVSAVRQKLVVFIGTHNIGKSTTALQLLRAGWHFVADGMLLLRVNPDSQSIEIGGYPTGEVKLRDDVLALFPEYSGESVRVREQRKTVVNLRALHPERVVETTLVPKEIHLCLAERSRTADTTLAPLTAEAARPWLAQNTVYWDEAPQLAHNIATLNHLLAHAHLHHIQLGTDTTELLTKLESL